MQNQTEEGIDSSEAKIAFLESKVTQIAFLVEHTGFTLQDLVLLEDEKQEIIFEHFMLVHALVKSHSQAHQDILSLEAKKLKYLFENYVSIYSLLKVFTLSEFFQLNENIRNEMISQSQTVYILSQTALKKEDFFNMNLENLKRILSNSLNVSILLKAGFTLKNLCDLDPSRFQLLISKASTALTLTNMGFEVGAMLKMQPEELEKALAGNWFETATLFAESDLHFVAPNSPQEDAKRKREPEVDAAACSTSTSSASESSIAKPSSPKRSKK